MKLPEYLLSTPRLVLVMFALALIAFAGLGIIEGKEFLWIAGFVFGYFFGSRGSEATDWKTEKELEIQNKDLSSK